MGRAPSSTSCMALATLLADQAVGVVATFHEGDLDGMVRQKVWQNSLHRAKSGALAGIVAVEAQDRHPLAGGRQLPQLQDLAFGQRGAERGHGALEAGAHQRDHVHVAFDHDHRLAVGGGLPRAGSCCRAACPCGRAGCRPS